jgi:hypothetical protein
MKIIATLSLSLQPRLGQSKKEKKAENKLRQEIGLNTWGNEKRNTLTILGMNSHFGTWEFQMF